MKNNAFFIWKSFGEFTLTERNSLILTSPSPTGELRDWIGARHLPEVLSGYPCALLRGSRRGALAAFLAVEAPGAVYDASCSTRLEEVITMGVDCQGRLTDDNGDGMP